MSAAEGFTTVKAHGVNLNQALQRINASSGEGAAVNDFTAAKY